MFVLKLSQSPWVGNKKVKGQARDIQVRNGEKGKRA
jgi:hypothetical protein